MTIIFLMQDTGSVYGAERATLELARAMRALGNHVDVCLLQEERLRKKIGSLEAVFRSAGLGVHGLPIQGRFSTKGIQAVRDLAATYSCPVLHAIGYKADIHAGMASGWGRIFPIVSTVHGWLFRPQPKELLYQWLDLIALRRYNRVISLSRWYADYLGRQGISRVDYIPIGIEPDGVIPAADASKLFDDESSPFTFGMLGRLSWEKNQSLFVDAISRLQNDTLMNGVRFWIAGEGPDRLRLERKVARLRLGHRVVMKGFMDSHDFFQQVHVLVQCSRMENLPYSVLEAMAWQRPVVGTSAGGLPELIDNGQTGWICPSNHPLWLAELFRTMAGQRRKCQAMGLQGRAKLSHSYAPTDCLKKHIKLYEECIGSS